MKPQQTTKFYILSEQINELFVSMLNDQINTKIYSSIPELFKNMRSNQLQMINNSGMKKDVDLIKHPTTFCYMLVKAFCKSDLKDLQPQEIATYIYHNIVLTGIHTCPDTIIGNMENEAKRILNV